MTNDDVRRAVRRAGAQAASELLTQRHMDLAASIQAVTEEIVLRLTRSIAKETGERNLCLAGGVALNCVANGKLLRDSMFDRIWVQPAAGDAGGALGAALAAYHMLQWASRASSTRNAIDGMKGSYLGPSFADDEIAARLTGAGAKFTRLHAATQMIDRDRATRWPSEKAVGWFQGRMEFGPRALGARSILGDARSPAMQKIAEPQGQISREFPPVRAGGAARGCRRLVRARRRQPLHAAGAPMSSERAAAR